MQMFRRALALLVRRQASHENSRGEFPKCQQELGFHHRRHQKRDANIMYVVAWHILSTTTAPKEEQRKQFCRTATVVLLLLFCLAKLAKQKSRVNEVIPTSTAYMV